MKPDIVRTMAVVTEVEDAIGYIFEPEEVAETVDFTIRKCEVNGKDEEYFFLLLEDELRDLRMRQVINALGALNMERRSA